MSNLFILIGSLSGGVGVALGAFGSHALKKRFSPEQLITFETGVHYQFYHIPGFLGAAWALDHAVHPNFASIAGWLFLFGTLIFSGSLYLLTLSQKRWLGAITPIGGIAFIGGWICLALSVI